MALVQSHDHFSGGKFCNFCTLKMAFLHLGPIIFHGNDKIIVIYEIMVCCQLQKTVQGNQLHA